MKVCFVGLGSIGKRHLLNLIKVCPSELHIDALRSGKQKLDLSIACYIEKEYYSIQNMDNDYDVIFITNPTSYHGETVQRLCNKTKNFFIEKPIFNKYMKEINTMKFAPNVNYVACPLRHKEIMRYIKKQIIIKEKVISVRAVSSSYLPNWRKNQDYRKCYSSSQEMGGGVQRDLIHEWDYLVDLFGFPDKVEMMSAKLSDLEISSDDVTIYIAKYKDKFIELHLDYFGHKTERKIELYCDGKTYIIDLIKNKIEEYKNNQIQGEIIFDNGDFYEKEMKYFLCCIEGNIENINPPEKANKILALAMGDKS